MPRAWNVHWRKLRQRSRDEITPELPRPTTPLARETQSTNLGMGLVTVPYDMADDDGRHGGFEMREGVRVEEGHENDDEDGKAMQRWAPDRGDDQHAYSDDTSSSSHRDGVRMPEGGGYYDSDGETELEEPTKEKGVQSEGSPQMSRYRYRIMMWEYLQHDGCWHGRWIWSGWEDRGSWAKRVADRQELAIGAWDATDVPQEILLRIIKCLVGSSLSAAREIEAAARADDDTASTPGLGNLALVCRAWYTLLAPTLYSKLVVGDGVVASPLRKPVAEHARQIIIRSDRPIVTGARMAQSTLRPAPAVVRLQMWGPAQARVPKPGYHPLSAAIYSQIHRPFSSVFALDLHHCHFLSSSDLLRLLASFSALERIRLNSVTVAQVSHSVIGPGRPLVRHILTEEDCQPLRLLFITHCWTWPQKSSNTHGSPFLGLLPAEQPLVARFSDLVMRRPALNTEYHLDAMDTYGGTWVASAHASPTFQVEFHLSQHDTQHSGTGCVHHCLLRMRASEDVEALAQLELAKAIGGTLNGFAYLETVVVETGHALGSDHKLIQVLIDLLRNVWRPNVQHRSSDEAHELALQAKTSTHSLRTGLLSPFWCAQKHVLVWDRWLSKEYRKDLRDEDKQGWDPSRSYGMR